MARTKKTSRGEAEGSRKILPIEFTAEQWAALQECAAASGSPVSTWIRSVVLEKAYTLGVWRPFVKKSSPEDEEST